MAEAEEVRWSARSSLICVMAGQDEAGTHLALVLLQLQAQREGQLHEIRLEDQRHKHKMAEDEAMIKQTMDLDEARSNRARTLQQERQQHDSEQREMLTKHLEKLQAG